MAIADRTAIHIVQTALALRHGCSELPALEILDQAMAGHEHQDLDFSDHTTMGEDHTSPENPFGQLLRDAFAPELTPEHCRERDIDLDEAWQFRVLEEFRDRYDLW